MKEPRCAGNDFSLGRLFATPGALAALEEAEQTPGEFLGRHIRRDWGCLSEEDEQLNDRAVSSGARILSAYKTARGVKLWIITEAADADGTRSVTTVLLPEEY